MHLAEHKRIANEIGIKYVIKAKNGNLIKINTQNLNITNENNEEYKNDLLVKVYDKSGKVYNCDKRDLFIIFDESEKVLKGTYFNILLDVVSCRLTI